MKIRRNFLSRLWDSDWRRSCSCHY